MIDEEDQIEKVAGELRNHKNRRKTYTQGTIKESVKYERTIKSGRSKMQETLGFPNYFLS